MARGEVQPAWEDFHSAWAASGAGFGDLVADPKGKLDLPRGFSYKALSAYGETMDDGEFVPLKGVDFRERWRAQSMEEMFIVTSATMPQDRPGSLDDESYAHLLALILQENGVESGQMPLPTDPEQLVALAPGWSSQGGGLSPGAALPPWPLPPRADLRRFQRLFGFYQGV